MNLEGYFKTLYLHSKFFWEDFEEINIYCHQQTSLQFHPESIWEHGIVSKVLFESLLYPYLSFAVYVSDDQFFDQLPHPVISKDLYSKQPMHLLHLQSVKSANWTLCFYGVGHAFIFV